MYNNQETHQYEIPSATHLILKKQIRRVSKQYDFPAYFKPMNTLRQLLVRPQRFVEFRKCNFIKDIFTKFYKVIAGITGSKLSISRKRCKTTATTIFIGSLYHAFF